MSIIHTLDEENEIKGQDQQQHQLNIVHSLH